MPPARAQVDHSISGGGGPAPFLSKTYDMVGNSSTNDIISWSPTGNSFIVWDAFEFARLLLPTYFKHNNFSSFIRQLNTYGFRKIDSEKWEFANEDFVKGEKHLLKNIHRKKPVHSHTYPQGSRADPERTAFKEEIERLSSEKAALQVNILMSEHQGSLTKIQVDDLMCRYRNMEQRQEKLLSLLVNAIDDPIFVEQLAQKVECINDSTDKKKRRLPPVEVPEPDPENNSMNSRRGSPPDVEATFGQDSSDELRLKLSPSISDVNLGVLCTHSSDDDGLDMERTPFEGNCKDAGTRIEYCLFTPETVDHSYLDSNSTMPQNVDTNGSTSMNFLQEISFSEEGAGTRIKNCLFAPETDHSELDLNSAMLEHADTNKSSSMNSLQETSFSKEGAVTRSNNCLCAPKADHLELDLNSSMLQNSDANGSSSMNSLQDLSFAGKHGIVCCQLTLASVPFSKYVGLFERQQRQELSKTPLEAHDTKPKGSPNNKDMVDEDNHKNASKKAATINEEHEAPTPPRVNDVFWEQFLTEKPGSSDNEGRSLTKSFKQVTLLSLWAAK